MKLVCVCGFFSPHIKISYILARFIANCEKVQQQLGSNSNLELSRIRERGPSMEWKILPVLSAALPKPSLSSRGAYKTDVVLQEAIVYSTLLCACDFAWERELIYQEHRSIVWQNVRCYGGIWTSFWGRWNGCCGSHRLGIEFPAFRLLTNYAYLMMWCKLYPSLNVIGRW